jgi:hypothetical protein
MKSASSPAAKRRMDVCRHREADMLELELDEVTVHRPRAAAAPADPVGATLYELIRATTSRQRRLHRMLLQHLIARDDARAWVAGLTAARAPLVGLRPEPAWQRHVSAGLRALAAQPDASRRAAAARAWIPATRQLLAQLAAHEADADALCLM